MENLIGSLETLGNQVGEKNVTEKLPAADVKCAID